MSFAHWLEVTSTRFCVTALLALLQHCKHSWSYEKLFNARRGFLYRHLGINSVNPDLTCVYLAALNPVAAVQQNHGRRTTGLSEAICVRTLLPPLFFLLTSSIPGRVTTTSQPAGSLLFGCRYRLPEASQKGNKLTMIKASSPLSRCQVRGE